MKATALKTNKHVNLSDKQIARNELIELYYGNATQANPITLKGIVERILPSVQGCTPYYIVRDSHNIQHTIPVKNQNWSVNDPVELYVYGIKTTDNGVIRCLMSDGCSTNLIPKYGMESQTIEYKYGITIDSNGKHPKLSAWSGVIQNIAGMGNSTGGKIIVGVDKNGNVVGIDNEYFKLNLYNQDNAFQYPCNRDGWELYLNKMIKDALSDGVIGNIHISYEQYPEGTVCIIQVDPFDVPVWINKTLLYVRNGNHKTQLHNDAIVSHLCKRFAHYMRFYMQDNANVLSPTRSLPRTDMVTNPRYINFYSDGNVNWTRYQVTDPNLLYRVDVTLHENKKIVIAFDNGHVQVVSPNCYLSRTEQKKFKGYYMAKGVHILNVACVSDSSYILYKMNVNGESTAYIYPIDSISSHSTLLAQGNQILNMRGVTDIEAAFISPMQKNQLSHYCYKTKRCNGVAIQAADQALIDSLVHDYSIACVA